MSKQNREIIRAKLIHELELVNDQIQKAPTTTIDELESLSKLFTKKRLIAEKFMRVALRDLQNNPSYLLYKMREDWG